MKKIRIIFLLVLLIVGGLLIAQRKPITDGVKVWRANSLLERARAALEEEDVDTAWRMAVSAHQLRPSDVEVLRFLITSQSAQLPRHLYKITIRLIEHPEATLEDRMKCLSVFLLYRDFRRYKMYFQSLAKGDRRRPEVRLSYAQYLVLNGDREIALRILDRLPKDEPKSRLLRASILAGVVDEVVRKGAQEELALLLQSDQRDISLGVMRVIGSIPAHAIKIDILEPAVEQWINQQEVSDISIFERLVHRNIAWARAGGNDALEKTGVRETADLLGGRHPVEVGNWMLARGLWEEALAVVKEDGIDGGLALFEVEVKALEMGGEWEKLMKLLDDSPPDFSPIRVAAERGKVASHLGRKSASIAHWREAWKLAVGDSSIRNSFLELYQLARHANELDLAANAMIEACKNPQGILPSTTELTSFMIYLAENDRLEDLVKVTNQLLAREVFSPDLINNAIYLREIAGYDDPQAEALIAKLEERFPDVIGLRTSRIVLHINRGETDKAFAIAEGLVASSDFDKLPAVESIIIAGAFRLAGKANQSFEIDLDKKLNSLLGIEEKFYRKWFD